MKNNLLIIRNCYIVSNNKISEETDINISNGFIKQISKNIESINNESLEIDVNGMYLLPGIIDSHIHLILNGSQNIIDYVNNSDTETLKKNAINNLQKTLMNGITTVRDMGDFQFILLDLKKNIKKNNVDFPRIFSPGHMISSKKGHVKTISRETDGTNTDIENAILEQHNNNADFIKLIVSGGILTKGTDPTKTEMDKKNIFFAVSQARKLDLKTAVHVYNNTDIKTSIKAGVNSIEHASFASENSLKMAAKKNIYLVPTIKSFHDILDNKDIMPKYIVKNASMVLDNMGKLISNARKYNVKIAMGTDAGTPFNLHGDNLKELEYLSEYGLSNWEIINAATQTPAELLGIQNYFGNIKEGNIADLLLVDKNPIEDISALRKNLKYIIFKGTLYKDFKK